MKLEDLINANIYDGHDGVNVIFTPDGTVYDATDLRLLLISSLTAEKALRSALAFILSSCESIDTVKITARKALEELYGKLPTEEEISKHVDNVFVRDRERNRS